MEARSWRRRFLTRFAALALIAAFGPSAAATAQCPAPDKLDGGPCCAPTAESIPPLKKFTQSALDICWRDCGTSFVGPCRARWTPLHVLPSTGPDCGYKLQRLELFDPLGTLKWSGNMRLLYSRTWLEIDPSGVSLQVWRYLVNGDLRPTAAVGPAPCPLPPCAPAFGNRVRFTGYIDYALDCTVAGAVPQTAWMLSHVCDIVDHAPGFPRAGVFHPDHSYTFVGPAAGFVPSPVVAIEGTPGSPFSDVRRLRHPLPGTTGPIRCEYEERASHTLLGSTFCLCSVGPILSMQWFTGPLTVAGTCGSSIGLPGFPVPGFVSMGIGSWTLPGVYPGVEDLRWNVGAYADVDPCTGVTRNAIFYGVTTLGGNGAVSILSGGLGPPLPLIFIDQADSISTPGTAVANVPFRSEIVLNLNH
jgi:hypothetical protein